MMSLYGGTLSLTLMLFKSEMCVGKIRFFSSVYEWIEIVLKKKMIHLACEFMCVRVRMSVCICCKSIIGLLFLKRKWRQYTCIKHRSSMSFFLISSPSRDSKITSKWKFLWIRDSFALCAYHSQLLCYNLYRFLFTHWILFYHSANTWNHKID